MNLAKIFGIPIKIHPSFLILAGVFFLFSLRANGVESAIFKTLPLILLFIFVLLHELGHALAAKYFKINTKDITLYPFGGIARISQSPNNCWEDLIISFAGPLANFLIAALLFLISILIPAQFLILLILINIAMGAFNLIPIYPLDGGRILNAILSTVVSENKAKIISLNLGMCFNLILFAMCIFFIQNLGLLFINIVLFFMIIKERAHLKKANG